MKVNYKAHAAVLGANFFFGAAVSAVKYISPSVIQPYAINVVRVLTALPLFWLLFAFKPGKIGIQKKHIPLFLVCALTGVAVNQLLFIKGLSLTSPIHGSLLSLVTPIAITVIAVFLAKEKITTNKIIGFILGISGALTLVLSKNLSDKAADIITGDILIIINALSYSFYLVLVKPLMQLYTPLHVIRWVFTFGTLMILPFGWYDFIHTDWSLFNGYHFFALGFCALGATFFAYLFNVYGIAHLGSSVVGYYIYTQPIFASTIAIVLFNEKLSAAKMIAALLIFAGVYLVNQKNKLAITVEE